jgi:hypothetical protein
LFLANADHQELLVKEKMLGLLDISTFAKDLALPLLNVKQNAYV